MTFRRTMGLFMLLAVLALVCAGCSDDDKAVTNTSNGGLDIQLSDYGALVRAVAPAVFTEPAVTKPHIIGQALAYEDWVGGDWPILGKVFSDDEPMALYRNLDDLDMIVSWVNGALESGGGSYWVDVPDDAEFDSMQVSATITELTEATTIPTQCQAGIGATSLDLDYLVEIGTGDSLGMTVNCGFKKTEQYEMVLYFFTSDNAMQEQWPDAVESNLFYGYRDLATDSVQIRDVFYKDYTPDDDSSAAAWVYQINTVGGSNFFYRMSWYSCGEGAPTSVYSVIGGGNKDTEFAFRYMQFSPPTETAPDPEDPYGNMVQVFDADYGDAGTTLTTAYEALTDSTQVFLYDDFPTTLISNPLNVAEAMNPWYGR